MMVTNVKTQYATYLRSTIKFSAILTIFLLTAIYGNLKAQDSTRIKLAEYQKLYNDSLINQQEYERLKSNLLELQPQSATTVVKIDTIKPVTAQDSLFAHKMYMQGRQDAQAYFKPSGATAGTFIATMFGSPLIGLIPAIACSNSSPKIDNLNYPDYNLYKNNDYAMGYMMQARKKKRQNVWTSYGIATFIDIMGGVVTGIVVSRKNNSR